MFTMTAYLLLIMFASCMADESQTTPKAPILEPSVARGKIPAGTFPVQQHPVDTDMVIRLPPYARVQYKVPDHFKKRQAKILFWTPAYGNFDHWFWWFNQKAIQESCPDVKCEFTIDQSQVDSSDAVVFQGFAGSINTKGTEEEFRKRFPPHRQPHQRYIYYNSESPEVGRDLSCLNGLFNWTLTYRRDSDVVVHYGRTALYRQPLYAAQQHAFQNFAARKRKLVAWCVSHCETFGEREKFVAELHRYVPVDVYGACGNLTCQPPRSESCYRKLAGEYKFYLSFENKLCRDYATEKFTRILSHDMVPVVFGGADYTQMAPVGSYINALDFEGGPRHLANYLLRLDADDLEYSRFFDWRRGYDSRLISDSSYVCELCIKLMSPDEPLKVYEDFEGWWNREAGCRKWSPDSMTNSSSGRNDL